MRAGWRPRGWVGGSVSPLWAGLGPLGTRVARIVRVPPCGHFVSLGHPRRLCPAFCPTSRGYVGGFKTARMHTAGCPGPRCVGAAAICCYYCC